MYSYHLYGLCAYIILQLLKVLMNEMEHPVLLFSFTWGFNHVFLDRDLVTVADAVAVVVRRTDEPSSMSDWKIELLTHLNLMTEPSDTLLFKVHFTKPMDLNRFDRMLSVSVHLLLSYISYIHYIGEQMNIKQNLKWI